MEGPSAIRLWPGLYFDSDTKNTQAGAGGKKLLKGEGLSAKFQVRHTVLIVTSSLYTLELRRKVSCRIYLT